MLIEKIKSIKLFGFSDFFIDELKSYDLKDQEIYRVITHNREIYQISNGEKNVRAELAGKFQFSLADESELPTVGDFVLVNLFNSDEFAIINEVINRESKLSRKSVGTKCGEQVIAANINKAFIIQGLDDNYNLRRVERYLVALENGGIEPIILFSKLDKLKEEDIIRVKKEVEIYQNRYRTCFYSIFNEESISAIREMIQESETICFIGSSGVGKSTLINILLNEETLKTQSNRKGDSKGFHTTTQKFLVKLNNGSFLIDTPGMRSFAIFSDKESVDLAFADISIYTKECKFRDCTHTIEESCGVLNALENGEIDENEYRSFIKLRKEAEYISAKIDVKEEKKRKQKWKNISKFGKALKKSKKERYSF